MIFNLICHSTQSDDYLCYLILLPAFNYVKENSKGLNCSIIIIIITPSPIVRNLGFEKFLFSFKEKVVWAFPLFILIYTMKIMREMKLINNSIAFFSCHVNIIASFWPIVIKFNTRSRREKKTWKNIKNWKSWKKLNIFYHFFSCFVQIFVVETFSYEKLKQHFLVAAI